MFCPRLGEDAQQADDAEPEAGGGFPPGGVIEQHQAGFALHGEREGGNLAVMKPARHRKDGMRVRGMRYFDFRWEHQSMKAGVSGGQSLKFHHHLSRGQHTPIQKGQQGLLSDDAEVQDDRSVRNDDHNLPKE